MLHWKKTIFEFKKSLGAVHKRRPQLGGGRGLVISVKKCDRYGGGGQKIEKNADVVYGRPLKWKVMKYSKYETNNIN